MRYLAALLASVQTRSRRLEAGAAERASGQALDSG
jgi:hypothetical protein